VNAYIYWNMILAAGGESTWGWKQNSMITVDPQRGTFTRQPEFYVMKHLSHYVQPGATVLGVCGDWSGNALAFENPDGERVLLAHNPLGETRELAFGGEGGGLRIEMPPMSFHTLVVPAEKTE
jgi:glucosylceramidase